ncbi:MAG: homogentisate 1,2-dioxygenase, partial [Burkholderiales bacterium]
MKKSAPRLSYQSGFGNTFASEAVRGALPVGQNSPQRTPKGLYPEVLSGTAFTAPRAENQSTWMYRLWPSAMHATYKKMSHPTLASGPFDGSGAQPNRMRWDPFPLPSKPTDFLDGLATLAGSGSPEAQSGIAVHLYRANRSMARRCFWNADGEMMLVPQQGRLSIFTELGKLEVAPGEICVVPRGMRYRVELPDGAARGYACENYGAAFRLPELG